MERNDLEKRARRRVGLKIGWMIHATVYVLVNLGLYAIDALGGGHGWHVFPLAGWGLGLAIHGIVVLVALGGGGLRERMLAREIEALKQRQ
jgi:hypothetical protein